MTSFYDLSLDDVGGVLAANGMSREHAKSLYYHAYRLLKPNPWTADSLPRRLAATFPQTFRDLPAAIKTEAVSRYDQSVKFVVALADSQEVEMVLIPEKARITLCVSSQVGCRQACSFCHTGRMGLRRNLSAGEIVSQVYLANRWMSEHPQWQGLASSTNTARVSNIVFMGMGEPLDNVDAVAKAIEILVHPRGFNLGLRKISVSTSGHIEGLRRLRALLPRVPIAISLHSPFDGERSRLMPINRRWPISELIAEMKDIAQDSDRPVLVQYTLIKGVNDSAKHAEALVDLLRTVPVKVNIIPFNEIAPSQFASPEPDVIKLFKDMLHQAGIRAMVRYSKGQDIGGACGQLVS